MTWAIRNVGNDAAISDMIGAMQLNVGGRIIYKTAHWYSVVDCRNSPFSHWGTLPLIFNIWQNIGQLKIYFLAVEFADPLARGGGIE